MKLNTVERMAMNNVLRAAHQNHREAAWFADLGALHLRGAHVLEVGCGRGVGVELLLRRFQVGRVTAFDLDPLMVDAANRRLAGHEQVTVAVGDACEIEQPRGSVDAVVEFAVIHHVPDWQRAIAEIARVLRPGGLLLFEDIPRHTLETRLFQTFTVHPQENRFEGEEFAEELVRHGLQLTAPLQQHFGEHVFVGAARRTP